jgi:predicted metalloprotease
MRLSDEAGSYNVEDRRGRRMPSMGRTGLGCVGLIVVVVISLITGVDPRRILSLLGGVQQERVPSTSSVPAGQAPVDDPQSRFVSKVLRTTETSWGEIFQRSGKRYQEPTLVLFDGRVDSACGLASSAVGPFYCPSDQKVYLDLAFFRELDSRFGASGDFAQAYVVAHEIGHHVQNLLGISDKVRAAEQRAHSRADANRYSVRLELQADCFAGVWGKTQQHILDPGDVEEGLRAAAAIGDDTLQKMSRGSVAPESWTHGSSEMRVRWLKQGLQSGNPASCDTFQAPRL